MVEFGQFGSVAATLCSRDDGEERISNSDSVGWNVRVAAPGANGPNGASERPCYCVLVGQAT